MDWEDSHKILKSPHGQKVFLGFGISITSKSVSNPKKWILMPFGIKSSLKFPALATPNEVDRVMKDWWWMPSL